MIFEEKPEDFSSRFEHAGCFCEHDGEILLLHRWPHKSEGDTWCLPGGKRDIGESLEDLIAREIEEETGFKAETGDLKHFKEVYARFPGYDIVHHIFHLALPEKPEVKINTYEHDAFLWVSPQKALEKDDLIGGLDECIKLFYRVS